MRKLTKLLVAYSDELENLDLQGGAYRSLYKHLRLIRVRKVALERLFWTHIVSKCISVISTYGVAFSLKIVEFNYKFIIITFLFQIFVVFLVLMIDPKSVYIPVAKQLFLKGELEFETLKKKILF